MKDSKATNSNHAMPVPLLDVVGGNAPVKREIMNAISNVMDSGRFLHGPDCRALEAEIARRCQVSRAVSCASGSDALLLAMMALEIGAGDEVILPSFTFFATASCVWRVGARPVFVDIDPSTFNIDPAGLEAATTRATKAIIPVHLFGQCADMHPINKWAEQHEVYVIEDAAQSIGARYHGRPAGSLGHVGCFSFYPTKNLGGMGDGGMLTTNDHEIADRLQLCASHGMKPRYYHQLVGINSRLDSFQAAVLNVKIKWLDQWNEQRQNNAARYHQIFADKGLSNRVQLPVAAEGQHHVWNQYTIRVMDGQRDELRAALAKAKIGTETYYPVPLHLQACFQSLRHGAGSLPETERAASHVLSLPIFPELAPSQQESVVNQIAHFHAGRPQKAA